MKCCRQWNGEMFAITKRNCQNVSINESIEIRILEDFICSVNVAKASPVQGEVAFSQKMTEGLKSNLIFINGRNEWRTNIIQNLYPLQICCEKE